MDGVHCEIIFNVFHNKIFGERVCTEGKGKHLFIFGRRRNGGEEKGGRFERMNAFHSCLLGLPCIRKEKACSKTKGTQHGYLFIEAVHRWKVGTPLSRCQMTVVFIATGRLLGYVQGLILTH